MGLGSEIQDPGSRILGSNRHRIPDPQHCFYPLFDWSLNVACGWAQVLSPTVFEDTGLYANYAPASLYSNYSNYSELEALRSTDSQCSGMYRGLYANYVPASLYSNYINYSELEALRSTDSQCSGIVQKAVCCLHYPLTCSNYDDPLGADFVFLSFSNFFLCWVNTQKNSN